MDSATRPQKYRADIGTASRPTSNVRADAKAKASGSHMHLPSPPKAQPDPPKPDQPKTLTGKVSRDGALAFGTATLGLIAAVAG